MLSLADFLLFLYIFFCSHLSHLFFKFLLLMLPLSEMHPECLRLPMRYMMVITLHLIYRLRQSILYTQYLDIQRTCHWQLLLHTQVYKRELFLQPEELPLFFDYIFSLYHLSDGSLSYCPSFYRFCHLLSHLFTGSYRRFSSFTITFLSASPIHTSYLSRMLPNVTVLSSPVSAFRLASICSLVASF